MANGRPCCFFLGGFAEMREFFRVRSSRQSQSRARWCVCVWFVGFSSTQHALTKHVLLAKPCAGHVPSASSELRPRLFPLSPPSLCPLSSSLTSRGPTSDATCCRKTGCRGPHLRPICHGPAFGGPAPEANLSRSHLRWPRTDGSRQFTLFVFHDLSFRDWTRAFALSSSAEKDLSWQ